MTTESVRHEPVMMDEVILMLGLKQGMFAVDGTLGLAGHASAIYERIQPGGELLGTDWDLEMLAHAKERLKGLNVTLEHADYRELPEIIRKYGRKPDAILLDLGLNSAQLDDPERGIAFSHEGPLDMRLDKSRGEPASALLNRLSEDALEKIFREYGGEKWSRRVAKIILERRKLKPLKTTTDLVDCVLAAIPASMRDKRIHPATRVFQAVRIAVNKELEDLEGCIRAIALTLNVNGRMVVLSYHDGEDRPTKRAFRDLTHAGFEELTKKPLTPSLVEVDRNRRSRSAKLRAIQRIKEEAA